MGSQASKLGKAIAKGGPSSNHGIEVLEDVGKRLLEKSKISKPTAKEVLQRREAESVLLAGRKSKTDISLISYTLMNRVVVSQFQLKKRLTKMKS